VVDFQLALVVGFQQGQAEDYPLDPVVVSQQDLAAACPLDQEVVSQQGRVVVYPLDRAAGVQQGLAGDCLRDLVVDAPLGLAEILILGIALTLIVKMK
jgi:hypothetical protein